MRITLWVLKFSLRTDSGFLEKVRWKEVEGDGDWVIFYHPGQRARDEAEKFGAQEIEIKMPEQSVEQLELPVSKIPETEIVAQGLVEDMVSTLGDEKSKPFYLKLARMASQNMKLHDIIYQCLSEVRYEYRQGLIKTRKGAAFTDKLKRYCQEKGVELGLKGQ